MQFAKDSFFKELCARILAINPERAVVLDGVRRAAVVVLENERAENAERLMDVFCLSWSFERNVESWAPHSMDCSIVYRSRGNAELGGVDRGRRIGMMDAELRQALCPAITRKIDHTQSRSRDLGSHVFWGEPHFEEMKESGAILERNVNLKVFYYPENIS